MSENPIRPIAGKPTPILDGILADLACDIELERLLQDQARAAGWGVLEQAREAFWSLVEHQMPHCSGDEWKLLSYLWGQTWGQGRGAYFVPLTPFQITAGTGLSREVVGTALDRFIEWNLVEWRPTFSPTNSEEKGTAYRLRIPGLEVQ